MAIFNSKLLVYQRLPPNFRRGSPAHVPFKPNPGRTMTIPKFESNYTVTYFPNNETQE